MAWNIWKIPTGIRRRCLACAPSTTSVKIAQERKDRDGLCCLCALCYLRGLLKNRARVTPMRLAPFALVTVSFVAALSAQSGKQFVRPAPGQTPPYSLAVTAGGV